MSLHSFLKTPFSCLPVQQQQSLVSFHWLRNLLTTALQQLESKEEASLDIHSDWRITEREKKIFFADYAQRVPSQKTNFNTLQLK